MNRVLEPQLIDQPEAVTVLNNSFSVKEADFFLESIQRYFANDTFPKILDFCCGTGDFTIVLARAKTGHITAIDGSALVLKKAKEKINQACLDDRIYVKKLCAPFLIDEKYDFIYSLNSLHHFHNPADFWQTIKNHTKVGTKILVIDLHRPPSTEIARKIVNTYEDGESARHQIEAYNSLLASFEIEEVVKQLADAQLKLHAEKITTAMDDFNFIVVWGEI